MFVVLQWQTATSDQREPQGPQDVAAQPEQPADDVLPILPPNFDNTLCTFFDLHAGQEMDRLSLLDLNKISKILLHFLHVNS